MATIPKKKGIEYGSTVEQLRAVEEKKKKDYEKQMSYDYDSAFKEYEKNQTAQQKQALASTAADAAKTRAANQAAIAKGQISAADKALLASNPGTVAANARALGVPNPLIGTAPASAPVTTPAGAGSTSTTTQPTQATSQGNYASQIQEILTLLRGKAEQTAVDPTTAPGYQAAKQAADLRLLEDQSTVRRAMASRNMLRSTPAIQALDNSAAANTIRFNAEVVPQLIAAEENRRQREFNNYNTLLNQVTGLDDTQFNRGITEAGITEVYKGQQTPAGIRRDKQEERLDSQEQRSAAAELRAVEAHEAAKKLDALKYTEQEMENQIAALKLKAAQTPDPNAKALAEIELQKAQAELNKVNAEVKATEALVTQRNADATAANALANQRNAEADKPKEVKTTADSIAKRWGVTNLGATTNYAAFDKYMGEWVYNMEQGGVNFQDVKEWVEANRSGLVQNGIDPMSLYASLLERMPTGQDY